MDLVTVAVPAASAGTFTNDKGEFKLHVVPSDTVEVIFSYLGYRREHRKLVTPSEKVSLTVRMYNNDRTLSEVQIREYRRQMTTLQKLDPKDWKLMPDASGEGPNHTGLHMGYFDVPGWEYERFFFEEFMPGIENRYRILADKQHRAISGLSMGGGGTAAYAFHHPELFSSACPMSALLDDISGSDDPADTFHRSVRDNSPVRMLRGMSDEQIKPLRTVRWWVDCGDDDFLWRCNVDFYTLMRERNIPLQYRMRDGGHTWRYWQTVLPDVLTFVTNGFGK